MAVIGSMAVILSSVVLVLTQTRYTITVDRVEVLLRPSALPAGGTQVTDMQRSTGSLL